MFSQRLWVEAVALRAHLLLCRRLRLLRRVGVQRHHLRQQAAGERAAASADAPADTTRSNRRLQAFAAKSASPGWQWRAGCHCWGDVTLPRAQNTGWASSCSRAVTIASAHNAGNAHGVATARAACAASAQCTRGRWRPACQLMAAPHQQPCRTTLQHSVQSLIPQKRSLGAGQLAQALLQRRHGGARHAGAARPQLRHSRQRRRRLDLAPPQLLVQLRWQDDSGCEPCPRSA